MKTVKKAWGREEWLANDDFCCKILHLKKNHQCSLHYHKNKDELFYMLTGKIELQKDNTKYKLTPGMHVRVKPKERHRFTGITDAIIIECSTHHEDSDSYRIEESK